jgi:hypothetical protein
MYSLDSDIYVQLTLLSFLLGKQILVPAFLLKLDSILFLSSKVDSKLYFGPGLIVS